MKNFKNIVYSDTPPSIHDLWIKGTVNSDDPFEIRIFKNNKWIVIDKGGEIFLEDELGDSEEVSMTQKAITEAILHLLEQLDGKVDNKVVLNYDPIENTGEETYNINLEVKLYVNATNITLNNITTSRIIELKEGFQDITIGSRSEYCYSFVLDGVVYNYPISFTIIDPIYYGIIEYKELEENNQVDFNKLIKVVQKDVDLFFFKYENTVEGNFYVISPASKNLLLTSNGFSIPVTIEHIKYLNTDYNIYKSLLLNAGTINNLIIKLI